MAAAGPLSRLLAKSLLRAGKRLENELKRGSNVLKLNFEVRPFDKYLKDVALLPGTSPSSGRICELLRQEFRRNKLLDPEALRKKESDALGLMQVMNNRAAALSSMVYEPTSVSVTDGISVSVNCVWQNERFQYTISIKNESKNTRQILRRRWDIITGAGVAEVVEGPGVVGHFPVISPGMTYVYQSYALTRGWYHGTMKGKYEVLDVDTKTKFDATIAPFGLLMTALPTPPAPAPAEPAAEQTQNGGGPEASESTSAPGQLP